MGNPKKPTQRAYGKSKADIMWEERCRREEAGGIDTLYFRYNEGTRQAHIESPNLLSRNVNLRRIGVTVDGKIFW